MNTPRQSHTLTLLPNGLVLATAGLNQAVTHTELNSAEIYNPATATWTNTGSLNTARQNHTATLLPNGLVLAAGGLGSSWDAASSAELYNPQTGTWTVTGSGTNFISPDGVANYTLLAGDAFVIPGAGFGTINTVASATSLTLDNWTGTTVSAGSAYKIYRFEGLPSSQVASLLANLLTVFTDANPPAYATVDTGAVRFKLDDDGSGNFRLRVRATGAAGGDAAYLTSVLINDSTGVVSFPDGYALGWSPSRRNRFINSNFNFWQRGTSFSLSASTASYTADRWIISNYLGVTGTFSKVSAPAGFKGQYALNAAAAAVPAADYFDLYQRIESQMCADMDGQPITISFDVSASTSAGTISCTAYCGANTALDNGVYSNILFYNNVLKLVYTHRN